MRRHFWRVIFLCFVFTSGRQAIAQSPAGSAPAAKDDTTGMTLNASFIGSVTSGADVYDWTTTVGYVFDRHFSANLGVPILFVRATTSTGASSSDSGLGNIFGQLQYVDKNHVLNFGAVGTLALPTGDSSKGLSTGRVTFDATGQVAKPLGRLTPFLSAGVANSIFDTRYWQRPYITLGDVAHLEGGASFAVGRSLTVSASAYDIAPWGSQKLYSRVVGQGISNGTASKHGRVYLDNGTTSGGAALDGDHGFNADLDLTPIKYLDFDFGYTRSVYFQTGIFSFAVGFNLTPLLRRSGISGH